MGEKGKLEGMGEEAYPITNEIVFEHVMRDAEIAKEVVEAVLHIDADYVANSIDIRKLFESEGLGSVVGFVPYPGDGVLLDVRTTRNGEPNYDVLLCMGNPESVGLRFRAHQALIDAARVDSGCAGRNLGRSYIVYLFDRDPFEDRMLEYTFAPMCIECPVASIDDGQRWIALNGKAWQRATYEPLRSLLAYIAGCDCAEHPEYSETDLVCKLKKAVARANADDEVRKAARAWEKRKDSERNLALAEKRAKIERLKLAARASAAELEALAEEDAAVGE